MLRVVWSSYRWVICDENDDEEKKTEGGESCCMKTNILAASLSDRTVRLIDGNTGTYLSIMDFEFISTQASFSLLGLVAVCVLDLTEMRFKLHASFFLDLHYDCLGSTERAKKFMKKAFNNESTC